MSPRRNVLMLWVALAVAGLLATGPIAAGEVAASSDTTAHD